MIRALAIAFALALPLSLAGCSGDTAGDACTSTDECQTGQTCYADLPGGYCAKGCTNEGTDKGCGSGTVCSKSGERLFCAVVCETKADCREAYECNGLTGSSLKSCRPKP